MSDLFLVIVAVIGIGAFVGGVIGYVILAPKAWNPKSQLLRKSVTASCSGMFGLFIMIIAVDSNYLCKALQTRDLGAVWSFVWSVLIYVLPAGILLTVGTYLKILMLRARLQLVQKGSENHGGKRG